MNTNYPFLVLIIVSVSILPSLYHFLCFYLVLSYIPKLGKRIANGLVVQMIQLSAVPSTREG